VAFEEPAHALLCQRVLAMPTKRHERRPIEFLNREEIDALLASADSSTRIGRRDRTLLLLAVQTGLRVSELTGLNCRDVVLGTGAHVRCMGKGRKERCTPLTKQAVEAEELVRRTKGTIEKSLGDYYIFEIDKNPVACVALHVYPEENVGELACLYVSASHENQGIGRKLIQFVENKARESGLRAVLALSTQAFTYFQSKGGFVEGTPEDLPLARREKYEQSGRHSKVLVKKL
jgi:N-acetylglutamate synthase-like GNAT family acetyltransferase